MNTVKYESLGEMIKDPEVVWYGPHACKGCGATVVVSSKDTGAVPLDAPHGHHYPNHEWRLHQCAADTISTAKAAVDLSVGKVIRIKSTSPHSHSVWRITSDLLGASQQENRVAIRRLELNPGNGVDGKTVQDSLVPMAILSTHPGIENV